MLWGSNLDDAPLVPHNLGMVLICWGEMRIVSEGSLCIIASRRSFCHSLIVLLSHDTGTLRIGDFRAS